MLPRSEIQTPASDVRPERALDLIRGRRVALLIESDGPGGAERMVAQLASGLAKAGCPSVVVVPARGEGWLAKELVGSDVVVETVRLDGRTAATCIPELASVFRRHRIELVHSHEFGMAVFGAWAARRAGLPHVITMHGGRYYASRAYRRIAMRMAIRWSRGVVAVSESAGRALRQDMGLREHVVRVIPNGVVPATVDHDAPPLRAELGLGPDDRLLLALGNLYAVKGHRYLIDAVALAAASHPDLHVAIAGRGGEEPELRAQAARLGVQDRVHLLGFRSDIGRLIAAADVFVMPSLSEGLPLALLEAMFFGRPIIATGVGEMPAVLEPDAGVIVPPADAEALAGAIQRLLDDRESAARLGANARTRAEAEFHFDRMLERYAAIYAQRLGLG
jgi:glycosyltransferase involved in cell wall biosynthesis